MINKGRSTESTGKPDRILSVCLSLIIILPFLLISFFNHPLGDDYWLSHWVMKYGFREAQSKMYDTVSARYTSLTLMSFNPLVFCNFTLFKIIPIAYIASLYFALTYFLRSLIKKDALTASAKSQTLAISASFIAIYLAIMPGIGEGIYWVSSLLVYQFGLLLFTIWLSMLAKWYLHKEKDLPTMIIACMCFLAIIGCNEILCTLVVLLNILIFFHLLMANRKPELLSSVCFIISFICVSYLLHSPNLQIRYQQSNMTEGGKLGKSLEFAFLGVGYYILKWLINPFFLVGIISAFTAVFNYSAFMDLGKYLTRKYSFYFIITCLLFMIIIEFSTIYFAGFSYPPLRVSNMMAFFFLLGILYFGMLLIRNTRPSASLGKPVLMLRKYRYILLLLLLSSGFILKNNVSIATREFVSGEADLYNKEMNQRYLLIRQCKISPCVIPSLRHRPLTIRYTDFDNDAHIGEYFNKKIIYSPQ